MISSIRTLALIILAAVATMTVHAQESYLPDPSAQGLGGLETQTVLDYFLSISHPKLLFNWHDPVKVAALVAKKDAGVPYLATNWTNNIARALTVSYGHAIHSCLYFNATGGVPTANQAEFIACVNNFTPITTIDGSYGAGSSQIGPVVAALFSYDALVGSGLLSQAERDAFKAKMVTQMDYIRANIPRPATVGNSSSLVVAVVGMTALVIPDETDSYYWLDWALKWHYMAYKELANEAAVMEGVSYQLGYAISGYCADFMVTLEEHGFPVVNRDDNFLEEIYTWMVKVHRPDMCAVEAEDCYQDYKTGHIWPAKYIQTSTEQRRALQWYTQKINNTNLTNNYITWDTSLDATDPPQWNPTQFFPTSSCAVFRNGFGGDESWLYFLGDRMPMYFAYGGVGGWVYNKNHGHNDATSVTLYAHGKSLLTETARFRGITTQWHNLIMVDGNDAEPGFSISSEKEYTELSGTVATPFVDAASMSINYVNTDFVRSVIYPKGFGSPANEYFAVIDDVNADDAQEHTYELLFHNKKGDITGSGKKRWTTQTDNSLAEIHFLEPDLISVIRSEHAQGTGTYPTMDFTDHRITARYDGQSFQYVTLLYPRTTAMDSPAVAELNGTGYRGGSLTMGAMQDIILSRKTRGTETLGGITSDAVQVWARTESGTPSAYMLKNGTSLAMGATTLISADVPLTTVALQYESATRISGALHLDRAANVTFRSRDGAVSSWKYFDAGDYPDFTFDLAAGGIVAGTVTDEDLGTPVPNVKVEAVLGSEVSYCYTDAAGAYRFDWVRPGSNTIRFSRAGYTTAQVTGQTVTSGGSITVDRVLAITTAAPQVLNASVLVSTATSADIGISTDKPCQVQVAYGPTMGYGSQTTRTSSYTEQTTVPLAGLTTGQLYHYRVTVWDYDGRQAQSTDQQFFPAVAFSDDFEDDTYTDKWTTASSYWSETGGILKKTSTGNFDDAPKRPGDIIFVKDLQYESFTLTAKARSLRTSDKKDVCFVFGYQDSAHFYYAQLSGTDELEYNGFFKVDGADRVKVGTTEDIALTSTDWTDVKLVRDMGAGAAYLFAGSMASPLFTLYDADFGLGRIGLASERSEVEFDDVAITPEAESGIMRTGSTLPLLTGLAVTSPVRRGNTMQFKLPRFTGTAVTVSLYAADGKQLKNVTVPSGSVISITTTDMPDGMAYYAIRTAEGVYQGKVLITL